MKKSNFAGILIPVIFIYLNLAYEYYHTIAKNQNELFIGSIIIVLLHISYFILIRNAKFAS